MPGSGLGLLATLSGGSRKAVSRSTADRLESASAAGPMHPLEYDLDAPHVIHRKAGAQEGRNQALRRDSMDSEDFERVLASIRQAESNAASDWKTYVQSL